jgi:hypothetical protein
MDLYSVVPGQLSYDHGAQDRVVASIGPEFERISVLIDSGPAAPPRGYVRVFTQSTEPIEIRDIEIGLQQSVAPAYQELQKTSDGVIVFKNALSAPRFRFASELLPARDLADARQVLVNETSFDPRAQATVEGLETKMKVEPGRIVRERIHKNLMQWDVETGARSFLVVGDSWFPGWTATVDNQPVKIEVVNGCMRGVFIEGAGAHTVEMRFWPISLTAGLCVTLLGAAMLCLLLWRQSRIDPH